MWAMPNKNTFSIKPINNFIQMHITEGLWLDPFSRNSPFSKLCITNDLDPNINCDYNLESLEFLKLFEDNSVDGVLFDPPYSPRQISECYKHVGKTVHMEDTQSSFYGNRKKEVARIIKPNGRVLSFGWNSGGMGKSLGFKMTNILLVAHGGNHNDTICTLEIKQ